VICQQREAIASPGAWLTKVASRICLDLLGSARARRETYVGEWIPEPLPDRAEWVSGRPGGVTADPVDRVTLDESVSMELGGGHGMAGHRAAAQRRVNPREEVIDLAACVAAHNDRERVHRRAPLSRRVRGVNACPKGATAMAWHATESACDEPRAYL